MRIDTPFADIHGFMNVALVGAILSTNRQRDSTRMRQVIVLLVIVLLRKIEKGE